MILPDQSIENSRVEYWQVFREIRDKNSPVNGYIISFKEDQSKIDSLIGNSFKPPNFPSLEVYKIQGIPVLRRPEDKVGELGVVLGTNHYVILFPPKEDSSAKEVLQDIIMQFNAK